MIYVRRSDGSQLIAAKKIIDACRGEDGWVNEELLKKALRENARILADSLAREVMEHVANPQGA